MRVLPPILLLCACSSELGFESIVEPPSQPGAPIADAGPDREVSPGDAAPLDGSGSHDPDGNVPLAYTWSLVSAPDGSTATLLDTDREVASVVTDLPGAYVVALTVGNTADVWDATPDRVVVTAVEPDVLEPVADAGPDQELAPLSDVTLDGSASHDPGGAEPLTYTWRAVTVPSGSTAQLSNPSARRPTFFADLAGDYLFELGVRNADGVWDSTPDQVLVTAIPAEGFYVELSWDTTADLDLHLLDGSSGIFGPGDCNFCNMAPSWGTAGVSDDPSLDWDAIDGWGPETITIDDPAEGAYTVKVHYYGKNGSHACASCPETTGTVNVYLGGVLAATFVGTLSQDDDVWDVATIDWPSGLITELGGMSTTPKFDCD